MKRTGIIYLAVLLAACVSRVKVTSVEASYVGLADSLGEGNAEALALILPYREKLEKEMSEVLNTSETEMVIERPEGLLGNFVADLCYETANEKYQSEHGQSADFCVLNNGGLRASLPKGVITRGKVFELMPFDNKLVVLTLNGSTTSRLFSFIAAHGGVPVSGIQMGIEGSRPESVFINGNAFDSTKTYTVITSDYLANGGDNMYFFKNPVGRTDLGLKVRSAIIRHLIKEKEEGRTLNSAFDGRIYYVH